MKRIHRLLCAALILPVLGSTAALAHDKDKRNPIVLEDQGSFAVGGNVVTNPGTFDPIALLPDGQTIHGDHAYAQYQIPDNARKYPLVLWHGGGQFSKTWETTPDGRDGFQNIFLRRNFSTYIIDQPHRGRAGRATTNGTINAVPGPGPTGEQGIFIRFRIGLWPELLPGRTVFARSRSSEPVVASADPGYGSGEQRCCDGSHRIDVQEDWSGGARHPLSQRCVGMDHRDQDGQRQGHRGL